MSRRSTVAQSKEAEREVARILRGRRLHAGEWHGKGDVDVIDSAIPATWVAQVKHRSGVPDYILEGMRQIHEAVDGTRLLPLLVIRTKPGRGREAQTFVVIDASCWSRLKLDDTPGA